MLYVHRTPCSVMYKPTENICKNTIRSLAHAGAWFVVSESESFLTKSVMCIQSVYHLYTANSHFSIYGNTFASRWRGESGDSVEREKPAALRQENRTKFNLRNWSNCVQRKMQKTQSFPKSYKYCFLWNSLWLKWKKKATRRRRRKWQEHVICQPKMKNSMKTKHGWEVECVTHKFVSYISKR